MDPSNASKRFGEKHLIYLRAILSEEQDSVLMARTQEHPLTFLLHHPDVRRFLVDIMYPDVVGMNCECDEATDLELIESRLQESLQCVTFSNDSRPSIQQASALWVTAHQKERDAIEPFVKSMDAIQPWGVTPQVYLQMAPGTAERLSKAHFPKLSLDNSLVANYEGSSAVSVDGEVDGEQEIWPAINPNTRLLHQQPTLLQAQGLALMLQSEGLEAVREEWLNKIRAETCEGESMMFLGQFFHERADRLEIDNLIRNHCDKDIDIPVDRKLAAAFEVRQTEYESQQAQARQACYDTQRALYEALEAQEDAQQAQAEPKQAHPEAQQDQDEGSRKRKSHRGDAGVTRMRKKAHADHEPKTEAP